MTSFEFRLHPIPSTIRTGDLFFAFDDGPTVLPGSNWEAGGRVPRNGAEVLRLGGAIARVGEDETAYSHRDAEYDFLAVGRWEDPAEDEIFISDARRSWAAVEPFVGRVHQQSWR